MRKILIALLGAAVLLTACSGGSSQPAEGVTYTATDSTGFDLVAGSSASIVFQDGHVSLNTGCNTATGEATWSGNTLKTGDYAITEMGCEEDLMTQEGLFVELLTNGPDVTRNGETLKLSGTLPDGKHVSVTFTEREQTPLENTHWELYGLGTDDGQTLTALPPAVSSTLAFTDTEVLVEYGCNSGGGPVTIDSDTLTFGELISTMMMCPPEAMDVEHHVTQVLQGETTYTTAGSSLTISNGPISLQYSPAE